MTTYLFYRWLELSATTPDIKANFEDLKVLGKGDFKALLKWRIAVRQEVGFPQLSTQLYSRTFLKLGLEVKTKPAVELTEVVEVSEALNEEQQLQEEVKSLLCMRFL